MARLGTILKFVIESSNQIEQFKKAYFSTNVLFCYHFLLLMLQLWSEDLALAKQKPQDFYNFLQKVQDRLRTVGFD